MQRNAGNVRADATCTSNFLHCVLLYSRKKEKSLKRSHVHNSISTLPSPRPRETDNDHYSHYKFACQKLVGLEVQQLTECYTSIGGGYITEHLSKQLIVNIHPPQASQRLAALTSSLSSQVTPAHFAYVT